MGLRDRNGGKIKWKLSEVSTTDVPRGQDTLIGKFKMATGDVISINPSSGYFPKLLAFPQWPFKSLSCLPPVPLKFSISQNQLYVEN